MALGITGRVERLNVAAARRVIEPDTDLPGALGPGRVLPDELLSIHGLDLDLTEEQRICLGREELAASLRSGILFEAILEAGFTMQIAKSDDVTDPRITFLLHEIGEETRHQRIFQRLVQHLEPTAQRRQLGLVDRILEAVGPHLIIALPALFHTLVLAGEEIPNLLQRRPVEHPDTDPFLKEVNRYHRSEAARHLSYARAVLPEAMRNVLATLIDAGALHRERLPEGWRDVCGLDEQGRPLACPATCGRAPRVARPCSTTSSPTPSVRSATRWSRRCSSG